MPKKPYPSIRVFENPYLEKLTHVHPIVPLALWGPVVVFLATYSRMVLRIPGIELSALMAAGFIFWTLAEYLLHRFVFHFRAQGPAQERLQFLIHGLHHDDPVDPTRLVMPPALSLILAVVLYTLFRSVFSAMGEADGSVPFFAGFVVGYLGYDYIHYSVHHFTPRTRLGKMIKQNHMLHHYATSDARWGVSSPFWDVVFGTLNRVPSRRSFNQRAI